MKKTILILGVAAVAILAGCTKENVVKPEENKVFEGDMAYMIVNLNDVGSATTRATSDSFLSGSASEYAVNDVHFYFYDNDGDFVTECTVSNTTGNAGSGNIEWEVNKVVTLSGLTGKDYPSWVITIVNEPAGFGSAPTTIEAFADRLADASSELYLSEYTNFTMTTSSYAGTDNEYDGTHWYATPLTTDNFSLEPITYEDDAQTIPDTTTPVDIYVERLAAKVTVAASEELGEQAETINGETYYKLTASLLDGDEAADQDLYIKFNGWKLNATAKKSLYVKDIDANWTNASGDLGEGWTWNDPDNYRSYWGMSYNYGLGTYPESSEGYDDETGANISDYLTYYSFTYGENSVGAYDTGVSYLDCQYCAENTNTAEIAATPSALTSIILSATVCDENGDPVEIIRNEGLLYTRDYYLVFALEHLPEVYVKTTEGSTTYYTLITTSILDLDTENSADGYVTVILNEEYENATFVYYDPETETEGDEVSVDVLEEALNQFNENYGPKANYFAEGNMYYNIPIEHLNNNFDTVYDEETGEDVEVVAEANYGVVRNHWYHVTITSVSNLGKGIAREDEIIVPLPDETTYYIGAQLHILAWKYVEQEVTL